MVGLEPTVLENCDKHFYILPIKLHTPYREGKYPRKISKKKLKYLIIDTVPIILKGCPPTFFM